MKIKNLVTYGALLAVLSMPIGAKSDDNCTFYRVKRGDTLAKIAKKYATTIETLGDLNELESVNKIYEGQTLIVPMNDTVSETFNTQDTLNYVVLKGDTLQKIAKRFNTTIDELVRINDIEDKDKIFEGEVLKVNGKMVENKPSNNNHNSSNNNYYDDYYYPQTSGGYCIQKGDTLAKISKKVWGKNYGTILQSYLGLSDDEVKNLQIGTVISLPSERQLLEYQSFGEKEHQDGNNYNDNYEDNYYEDNYYEDNYSGKTVAYHVVQKGENLTKIVCYYYRAEDVHANNLVDLVAEYNGLESKNDIMENDVIMVPLTYENSRLKGNAKKLRN